MHLLIQKIQHKKQFTTFKNGASKYFKAPDLSSIKKCKGKNEDLSTTHSQKSQKPVNLTKSVTFYELSV